MPREVDRHSSVPQQVPLVVLDTNVVLDWLLFADSRCKGLDRAIRSGSIRWVANASMQVELVHVLARGVVGGKAARSPDAVLAGWVEWAEMADPGTAPHPHPHPHPLRCRDPDDQKFIDFALRAGATSLLSRDRAVLALARPAARVGLEITSIERWTPPAATP